MSNTPDYKYHVKHRYPQAEAIRTIGGQWIIIDRSKPEPERLCLPHRFEPQAWYYAYCTMIGRFGAEGN